MLGSLQRVSDGWDNGWVYDPEQGSQFDAAIELVSRDRSTLTGYKGVKFFSKSFRGSARPPDLQRCDQPREARATPGDARAARCRRPPPRKQRRSSRCRVPCRPCGRKRCSRTPAFDEHAHKQKARP